MKKIILFVAFTLLLTGCGDLITYLPSETPTSTPTATPEPTHDKQPMTEDEANEPEPVVEKMTLDEQREYFIEFSKPKIDHIIDEFDFIWETIWVYTFQSVTEGKITTSEAWKKLDTAKKRYELIYRDLSEIPVEKLDQPLKKIVGSFSVEIEDAIAFRLEAINLTKKMLDKEEFPASKMNEVEELINDSSAYFSEGITYLKELTKELDLDYE